MSTVRYGLSAVLWGTLGILWLAFASSSVPWWVAGAVAALSFGRAALPTVQLLTAFSRQSPEASVRRGIRGLVIGNCIGGVLIAVGGAWQRSFIGVVVAYAAFSFAWVWVWVGWEGSQSSASK